MNTTANSASVLKGLLRQGGSACIRHCGEWSRGFGLVSSAGVNFARGRYEAALLGYGHLIRDVQVCRESMLCYRCIDNLVQRHPTALAAHRQDRQMPEKMLFFLGYSRSGHSLVGSLLDAHPDIVISHELHALKHVADGCSVAETVMAIKYNAYFYHLLGREYTGYDYQVPGQSQGRYRSLQIAGDKKGNGTMRVLRCSPGLLPRLESRLGRPFILLHVIRNPYDNIAAKVRRTGASLPTAMARYFANADLIQQLKDTYPDRVIDVCLDDLIAAPESILKSLLEKLGINNTPRDYPSACASILFKQPHRSARDVQWPAGSLKNIQNRLGAYPFLEQFLGEDAKP